MTFAVCKECDGVGTRLKPEYAKMFVQPCQTCKGTGLVPVK